MNKEQEDFLSQLPWIMRKNLSGYRNNENWEDSIQEGLIQAWKDLQDGSRDDTWIVRRAGVWAKASMWDDTKLPTGHPGRENTGIYKSEGVARREKVRMYVRDFSELHDRLPTVNEVSQGTGLPHSSAGYYLKNRNEMVGGYATKPDGQNGKVRLDRKFYQNVPLIGSYQTSGDEYINPEAESRSYTPSFENDVISRMAFEDHLSVFESDEDTKILLRLHHVYGWSDTEIGNYLNASRQAIRKRILRAHGRLRHYFEHGYLPVKKVPDNPYPAGSKRALATHCGRGHEFTEANTGYQKKGAGRFCRECERMNRRKRYQEAKAK